MARSMSGRTDNTSFISLHYALDLYGVVGGSRPTNGVVQSRKEAFRARQPLRRSNAVNCDSVGHIIDPVHGL